MRLNVFLFIEYRISMVFFWGFVLSFLAFRYRRYVTGAIAVFGFLATGLLEYAQFFVLGDMGSHVVIPILEILLVQGLVWLISDYRDFRAVFTGVTASTYVLLGNAVCTFMWQIHKNQVAALMLGTIVHSLLLLLLNTQIRSRYLEEMRAKSKNWALLCLIPALFYAIVYTMCIWPSSLLDTPEVGVAAILVLVVMVTSYILLLRLFSQRRKEYELERNNIFLETYASGLRHEMEALRKVEERLMIRQHDMRHLLRLIHSYLDQGRPECIYELLEHSETVMKGQAPKRYCENITINSIFKEYAVRTEEKKIAFTCEAEVPLQFEKANEFEIATVTANLLENALDASGGVKEESGRFIRVRVYPHKEQLLLEVSNGYEEQPRISRETGLPASTKGAGHGYGLRSVSAYAEQTGGIFEYKAENGIFMVRLLVHL